MSEDCGMGSSGLTTMVDRGAKYELLAGESVYITRVKSKSGREHIQAIVNKMPPVHGIDWCIRAICTPDKRNKLRIKVSVKKLYDVRHVWAMYTGLQRLGVSERQAKAAVARFWKDCDDLNGDG